MTTTEFKIRRLSLTKEERIISKSWGPLWSRFGALERMNKPIILVLGDWSGYRSSQYRITHVEHIGYHINIDSSFHGTVLFSDGTTMNVWLTPLTREEIIKRKLIRSPSYTSLINKLFASGGTFYKV